MEKVHTRLDSVISKLKQKIESIHVTNKSDASEVKDEFIIIKEK